MLERLQPTDSLIWTIAWQSSALLALGLAASFALRKRPARAHWALLAAMVAALISPAMTETGRRLGWGLWASPVPPARSAAVFEFAKEDRGLTPPARRLWDQGETPRSLQAAPVIATRAASPSISWRSAFLIAWAAASVLLFVRLAISFVGGWRLARSGRDEDDASVRARVEAAASRLGSRAVPKVRRSSVVHCPAVWCWGRSPLLLLPEKGAVEGVDWVGVFRHELAHWSRRDHISALVGEVLVCALPWNPLAWWSRGRLAQLAELACDDWALADGASAADYAESLLALTPQRRAPALAAVSSRRGLLGRVRRILAEGRREPAVGARWTLAVSLMLLAGVSALALAQARPTKADSPKPDQAAMKTAWGVVVDPDGKPVAGATVAWVGRRKPPRSYDALSPEDRRRSWTIGAIAETRSNDDGTFQLTAPFLSDEYVRVNDVQISLMVGAPGHGLLFETAAPETFDKELTLRVPEQVVINGRVLKPDGAAAAGVRATLTAFQRDVNTSGVPRPKIPDGLADFWPKPQVTDADGRFTIEGAPEGMEALVQLEHPGYAVDSMRVTMFRAAKPGNTIQVPEGEAMPVKPTFTHSLRPERFVVGRVIDKKTGEPLSGMAVKMLARHQRGMTNAQTRTDADGRYRFGGQSAEGVYQVEISPPADSGFLPASAERARPGGADAMELEINFALDKGRLIHGRVVDRDRNQPIVGAVVAYRPQRKPGLFESLFSTAVDSPSATTDANGRFVVTAAPGAGVVLVETGTDAYLRSPVELVAPHAKTVYPQGSLMVDVPRRGEPEPVEVSLRKGVLLEARVVDPEGEPVETVAAWHPGVAARLDRDPSFAREFLEGKFQIPGADPQRTYRVFFTNADRHLGAVADLKYDPTGKPIEVRLLPTATVRGKLVARDGKPPARRAASVHLDALLKPKPPKASREELWRTLVIESPGRFLGWRHRGHYPDRADENGEFQFDVLVSGVGYQVTGYPPDEGFSVPIQDLKPGEVRDLGTIEVK